MATQQLLEWACERGARFSDKLEVRDGERGRGVFATHDIEVGEELLHLPASLAVRPWLLPRCAAAAFERPTRLTGSSGQHSAPPPAAVCRCAAAAAAPLLPLGAPADVSAGRAGRG